MAANIAATATGIGQTGTTVERSEEQTPENDLQRGKVTYHGTRVWQSLRFYALDRTKFYEWRPRFAVTLRTGGWDTPTTRRRINQAAAYFGVPLSVYRSKGRTFVSFSPVDATKGETVTLQLKGEITIETDGLHPELLERSHAGDFPGM